METDTKKIAAPDHKRAALLGMCTLLSTIPFVSRFPFNWDAGQFILGAQQFSVAMHQPHPPGYPLFILFGKVFGALVSPHWAFVSISMLAGAATVSVTYLLLIRMWPQRRTLATLLAVVLMTNPALWMFRSVGLTYTIDALAMALMALITYRLMHEQKAHLLFWSAGVAAVAGGFRPSLLTFLVPFFLLQWGVWLKARKSWRPLLAQAAIAVCGVLAWAIPLVVLSGGVAEYRAASGGLFAMVAADTSLLRGATLQQAVQNVRIFVISLLASWHVVAAIVTVAACVWVVRSRRVNWSVASIVCAWIVVPTVIYGGVHFGQVGYVVIYVPLIAIVLMSVAHWLQNRATLWVHLLFAAVIAANLFLFLLAQPDWADPAYVPPTPVHGLLQSVAQRATTSVKMNCRVIVHNDERFRELSGAIQAIERDTVAVISMRNVRYTTDTGFAVTNPSVFREMSALFPEVPVIDIAPDRDFSMRTFRATTERIDGRTVILPDTVEYVLIPADTIEEKDMPHGIELTEFERYYVGQMAGEWTFLGYTVTNEGNGSTP